MHATFIIHLVNSFVKLFFLKPKTEKLPLSILVSFISYYHIKRILLAYFPEESLKGDTFDDIETATSFEFPTLINV